MHGQLEKQSVQSSVLLAPSGSPLNVTSQTLDSTSILVMWDEVPAVLRNGIITKYEVEYNHTAYSDADSSTQTINTSDQTTVLVDLHEYTEYHIRVRAYTNVGAGPYSNQTVSITLQDSKSMSVLPSIKMIPFGIRTNITTRKHTSHSYFAHFSLCYLGSSTIS